MIDKPNMTKVWAETADSTDIAVIPEAKFSQGWLAEAPTHEHFNYLQKYFSQALAYLNQEGVSTYDTLTDYAVGSLAKGSDNHLYSALIANGPDSTLRNPVGDIHDTWRPSFSLEQLHTSTLEINYTTNSDYTLSDKQNYYGRLKLTDTNNVLSATRYLNLSETQRMLYVLNNTARDIRVRRGTSGSGFYTVESGTAHLLIVSITGVINVIDNDSLHSILSVYTKAEVDANTYTKAQADTVVDDNMLAIEYGPVVIPSDANYTLTVNQNKFSRITFTGTLTATRTMTVSDKQRIILVTNSTSQVLRIRKVTGVLYAVVQPGQAQVLIVGTGQVLNLYDQASLLEIVNLYTKDEIDANTYTRAQVNTRTYTRDQVNANTYTRAQVNANTYTRAQVDTRTYTRDQVNANTYTRDQVDANTYTRDQVDDNTYTRDQVNANTYTRDQVNANTYTRAQTDTVVDDNMLAIEYGPVVIPSDANYTLTNSQNKLSRITFTGTLTATRTMTVSNKERIILVTNSTSQVLRIRKVSNSNYAEVQPSQMQTLIVGTGQVLNLYDQDSLLEIVNLYTKSEIDAKVDEPNIVAFSNTDATPDISGGHLFALYGGSNTTITSFTGSNNGDYFFLRINASTAITHGAGSLKLKDGVSIAKGDCSDGGWILFAKDRISNGDSTLIWHEMSRSFFIDRYSLGAVGQAWTDVLSNRSLNTVFQNSTGRPICVSVRSVAGLDYMQLLLVSTDELSSTVIDHSSNVELGHAVTAVIPDGQKYKLLIPGDAGLLSWRELR